ncbi:hypothetical protein [Methanoregula sp.]|uniref:hypothetical protein n=1 Tax=Methanoregula sp. TaxID=2052170 RepID=UPI003C72C43C
MKSRFILMSFLVLLLCSASASAASISTNTVTAANPQAAAALVYVSGYDLTPAVFYPGETGTVTVHVTNAANTSVSLDEPALIDPHIQVVNQGSFTTATMVGPGTTTDFNFIITVGDDVSDGTYFPLFTAEPNAFGGSPVHSQIPLTVDSADVRASIALKPETFAINQTDTVNVSIVNPRLGDISDVLIVTSGNGNDVSPSESFVGPIPAGTSVQVPFAITPHQQSDVTFNVSFRNGNNVHTTSVDMPLNIGESKSASVPVLNDIAIIGTGNTYTLTGDVTNAGITDASGMVLSVGAPATPVEPYSSYAVGALASDDFSSFTLTFTADDLSAVPVIVQWKDAYGNTLTTTKTLDLRSLYYASGTGSRSGGSSGGSSSGSGSASTAGGAASSQYSGGGAARGGGGLFSFGGGRGGGLSAFYPIIAGGIVLVVAIVLWMKRKWIIAKFRKQ